MVLTAFAVSIVIFMFLRIIPGNIVDSLSIESNSITEADRAHIERQYGLQGPLVEQYGRWIGNFMHGDLGTSFASHRPVKDELLERVPVTLELTLLALFLTAFLGVTLGVLAAVYSDGPIDHISRSVAVIGLSIPSFYWATLAIVYPSIWWNISPNFDHISIFDNPIGNFKQFFVPALILAAHASAGVARITRSSLLEVLHSDYIRTAQSKGLRHRLIIVRHALPNSLLPVVTVLGLMSASLIGGSVVIESIYQFKGIGLYVFKAISVRDYAVIQSTIFMLALCIMTVNFLVDISYGWLDPRVKVV
jgi:peptide/nickel transport system permease protein